MAQDPDTARPAAPSGRMGTFAGVFTPSILTILGIILFLRLGFVVGNAGLGQALVVILIANAISVLTSFSLSAIATNFEVRGGGDYFLISRSLGPEFGGALGIVLFLAQSISVAFYAIGFAEGVGALTDIGPLGQRLMAGAALLPLFGLAWMGSDWATRFQYGIMAVLILALGSFLVGALGSFDGAVLAANWAPGGTLSFWVLFALFFPAVTGFSQGVSMSGDLRDPAKSLPLGTFLAVGVSIVVYFGFAVLLAGSLPAAELIADYDSMARVSALPILISAGIFAATLSSALASFLGAPRILQALASDRLFGFLNPFAAGQDETGNPRRAVLLCFTIAAVTVAVGNLNLVAPIVSMFFLISYGLLNYATYREAAARSPSFRPRFRWYHRHLSLLGCLACAGTMIAINATAGAVALAVMFGIHQYLSHTGGSARWADGTRSALFQRIRTSLLEMNETTQHDRDWRPITLVFSDDPERRERIVRFATWIDGGSGLTTAVRAIEGTGPMVRTECARAQVELSQDLRARGLDAFARVVAMDDLESGFPVILQAAGIGPIRPNIALFNWFDREETAEDAPAMRSFGGFLRTALRHGCSVGILAARQDDMTRLAQESGEEAGAQRVLDVWWNRADASSTLALMLAYLASRRAPFEQARLRLLAARDAQRSESDQLAELGAVLDGARIRAEPVLVPDASWATLMAHSASTSLAFATIRVRPEGICDAAGELLPHSLEGLPPLVFVQAARELDLDAQPDEGAQAEQAHRADALEDAHARARTLRKEADELRAAHQAALDALDALQDGTAPDASPEALEAARRDVERSESELLGTERKLAASEVKAKTLADENDPPAGASSEGESS